MGTWKSTNGNTVSVLPFTDSGYKFITLDCEETIGGKIAGGLLTMVHDGNSEAHKLITEQETVDIELGTTKTGVIMTVHGTIMSRHYYRNFLNIEFMCAPEKSFFTDRGQLVFDNIDSAIKSLWKGKLDIRTKTDLPNGISLNQAGELNNKFLGTLCGSYKKNTIYALGLDCLLIKDLIGIDSTGNKEPYLPLLGEGCNVVQGEDNKFNLNYDYKLYKSPEDPWKEVTSDPSLNISAQIFNNKYRLIHKDYNILRENLYNNQKLYNSRMYNNLQVTNTVCLQKFRLGDVVKYYRPGEKTSIPFETYIISKIRYHYRTEPGSNGESEKLPFYQTYTLHGLEEKGKILNESDPKDQDEK